VPFLLVHVSGGVLVGGVPAFILNISYKISRHRSIVWSVLFSWPCMNIRSHFLVRLRTSSLVRLRASSQGTFVGSASNVIVGVARGGDREGVRVLFVFARVVVVVVVCSCLQIHT